jgi:hypothetical protein
MIGLAAVVFSPVLSDEKNFLSNPYSTVTMAVTILKPKCEVGAVAHPRRESVSKFEFVLIIVSLVLGLSITTLLQGMADLYRARRRVRLDCLTWFWVMALLATQAHLFFGSWGLRNMDEWKPLMLFSFMLGPILLFSSSILLLPRVDAETPNSMAEYREGEGRFSLVLLAIYHVWAVTSSGFMAPSWTLESTLSGLFIAAILIAAASVRHSVVSWVFSTVYLVYAALALFSTPALR